MIISNDCNIKPNETHEFKDVFLLRVSRIFLYQNEKVIDEHRYWLIEKIDDANGIRIGNNYYEFSYLVVESFEDVQICCGDMSNNHKPDSSKKYYYAEDQLFNENKSERVILRNKRSQLTILKAKTKYCECSAKYSRKYRGSTNMGLLVYIHDTHLSKLSAKEKKMFRKNLEKISIFSSEKLKNVR